MGGHSEGPLGDQPTALHPLFWNLRAGFLPSPCIAIPASILENNIWWWLLLNANTVTEMYCPALIHCGAAVATTNNGSTVMDCCSCSVLYFLSSHYLHCLCCFLSSVSPPQKKNQKKNMSLCKLLFSQCVPSGNGVNTTGSYLYSKFFVSGETVYCLLTHRYIHFLYRGTRILFVSRWMIISRFFKFVAMLCNLYRNWMVFHTLLSPPSFVPVMQDMVVQSLSQNNG